MSQRLVNMNEKEKYLPACLLIYLDCRIDALNPENNNKRLYIPKDGL